VTIRQQVRHTVWQVGLVVLAPVSGAASWLFTGTAHEVLQAGMWVGFGLAALSLLGHALVPVTPTCDSCGEHCPEVGLCDECVRVSEVA
jgi:hypothetical protein